jgi:ATP-dependent Lon protease
METTNKTTVNKTSVLPVAPLRDGPVYPNTDIPLAFGRSKSVAALKNAAESNHLIFVVAQKNPNEVETNPENLYQVGTICQVKHIFCSSTFNRIASGFLARSFISIGRKKDLPPLPEGRVVRG